MNRKIEEGLAVAAAVPKRKANSLDSSDDEREPVKISDPKKKRRIVDSDDEEEKPKKVKSSTKKSSPVKSKKLTEVDVFSMFGSEPVKRKERPKEVKKPKVSDSDVIQLDDDEFDQDLSMVVDDIERQDKVANRKKESPKASQSKSPAKPPTPVKKEIKKVEVEAKKEKSFSEPHSKTSKSSPPLTSPPSPKKQKIEAKPSSSKKEKKVKEVKESTAEEDQARHERKQSASALFHKFQNRASVLNHGCKEIPKGKPNCLKDFRFVITGVLESMEREEAADLIKSCGGTVTVALSKKVTHMLIGEESGPAKLAKAADLGIKQITEDELLSIIRKKSGLPEPSNLVAKEEEPAVVKDSPGKENRETNKEVELKKESKSPSSSQKKKDESKPSSTVTIPPMPAPQPKNLADFSFVDRYKPTSVKTIIGQQGPSGNAAKLSKWLANWHTNNDGKKKHAKPNPWAKDNDGSAFKAALLSGSPGVGKTTTAHLVAQELMFDIVEFNASDTRSKKLLKEEVSSLLSNKSLAGYFTGNDKKASIRHVLIMDEVDGMAGNEDRGGVAELIGLIKESHIPVICMCNDRNHPKIRSLANYCFDLRFHKPSTQQIRGAMMSVCFKEGIKLEAGAIDEIIGGTGNDIRQTLNHLALYSASKDTKLAVDDAKKNAQSSEKDIKIVSWSSLHCRAISLTNFYHFRGNSKSFAKFSLPRSTRKCRSVTSAISSFTITTSRHCLFRKIIFT